MSGHGHQEHENHVIRRSLAARHGADRPLPSLYEALHPGRDTTVPCPFNGPLNPTLIPPLKGGNSLMGCAGEDRAEPPRILAGPEAARIRHYSCLATAMLRERRPSRHGRRFTGPRRSAHRLLRGRRIPATLVPPGAPVWSPRRATAPAFQPPPAPGQGREATARKRLRQPPTTPPLSQCPWQRLAHGELLSGPRRPSRFALPGAGSARQRRARAPSARHRRAAADVTSVHLLGPHLMRVQVSGLTPEDGRTPGGLGARGWHEPPAPSPRPRDWAKTRPHLAFWRPGRLLPSLLICAKGPVVVFNLLPSRWFSAFCNCFQTEISLCTQPN